MNKIFKIKDSVDLYLSGEILTAYFINTRLQKRFKVNETVIDILENIDGKSSINEISLKLLIDENLIENFCYKLLKNKILVEVKENNIILNNNDLLRYDRQLNYFAEFTESIEEAFLAQKKLKESKLLIFGAGAVGSNIAIQLVMAGCEDITIYDYDNVEHSDITRHLYFNESHIGYSKLDSLKIELLNINKNAKISLINDFMAPQNEIKKLISKSTFVINTLDEPYIGYTSAKISRICTELRIPHYIGGGFDAHLASTGELIIPGITPCVECYTTYFKETLKNWKPKPHPISIRYKEIGGLSSMTLFSASFASIEIIKFITGIIQKDAYKTRGELLFKNLGLTYIKLDKNPNCIICGDIEVNR